jgi:hypothetical protein
MYPVVSPGLGESAAIIADPCDRYRSTWLFSRIEKEM